MVRTLTGLATSLWLAMAGFAAAQQSVWVQIEAHPSESVAAERAQSYAGALQFVSAHSLRSGWHAVALGPFSAGEANDVLRQLRITRQIPGDSYIVDGGQFTGQFWPDGSVQIAALPSTENPEPVAEPEPIILAEETVAEARGAERLLTREERQEIQTALQWEGFYNAAIDGAFGPGTRNSMADWQARENYETTGVLTTKQRRQLVDRYREVLQSIGMEFVADPQTGIDMELPLAMVELDRYEPPFAQFKERNNSGVSLILISQTGDEATLRGLFEIMQTLEVVPLEGDRGFGRNNFTIVGKNDDIASYTIVALSNGHVKGFTLIWPNNNDRRRLLVIDRMRASFRSNPDAVLPDVFGDANAAQSLDLLSGLAIRQPDISRSGFYVDEAGTVLTSADVVGQCQRITLDETTEAELVAVNPANGLALLTPRTALRPISHALLATGTPRLNSEIAISGYSYGGVLGAPTLTFGILSDVKGLNGEDDINRLAVLATQEDGGGPIFDSTGSVLGMLLPVDIGGAKRLPDGVRFSADRAAIVEFLAAQGLAATASQNIAPMAAEDLTVYAADMTVLVSCWN